MCERGVRGVWEGCEIGGECRVCEKRGECEGSKREVGPGDWDVDVVEALLLDQLPHPRGQNFARASHNQHRCAERRRTAREQHHTAQRAALSAAKQHRAKPRNLKRGCNDERRTKSKMKEERECSACELTSSSRAKTPAPNWPDSVSGRMLTTDLIPCSFRPCRHPHKFRTRTPHPVSRASHSAAAHRP